MTNIIWFLIHHEIYICRPKKVPQCAQCSNSIRHSKDVYRLFRLPHLLARVTAARRTNNFRKKTVSTYMRILYRIVGSSLCATWKRMLKVFKCELLFIFAADTHTHTYTQRVMLRAHFCCLLLCAAKIVRHLEHVWVARVCACVCVRASVYESQL